MLVVLSSFAPPSGLPAISPTGGEIGQSRTVTRVISPLVGEMAGRPEGGATRRNRSDFTKRPL